MVLIILNIVCGVLRLFGSPYFGKLPCIGQWVEGDKHHGCPVRLCFKKDHNSGGSLWGTTFSPNP